MAVKKDLRSLLRFPGMIPRVVEEDREPGQDCQR